MQFFARPSIGRINLRSGLVLGALWIGVGIAGYQANGGRGEIRNLASAALFSLSGALIFALGLALIFSERFRDFLLEESSSLAARTPRLRLRQDAPAHGSLAHCI